MLYIILAWLRTGSYPADVNRFQSHTGKNILPKLPNMIPLFLIASGIANIPVPIFPKKKQSIKHFFQ